MSDFPLTHASVMDLIAWRHSIAVDKRTALRGRLQHFQRKRFPPGANTGRGKPAAYGWDQLILLGVAFDLLELGLTPDLVIELVNSEAENIFDGLTANGAWKNAGIIPVSPCLIVLEMRALYPLKDDSSLQSYGFYIMTNDQIVKHLSGLHIKGLHLPISIIDLRGVVGDIIRWVSDIYGLGLAKTYQSFTDFFYPGEGAYRALSDRFSNLLEMSHPHDLDPKA